MQIKLDTTARSILAALARQALAAEEHEPLPYVYTVVDVDIKVEWKRLTDMWAWVISTPKWTAFLSTNRNWLEGDSILFERQLVLIALTVPHYDGSWL